MTLRRERSPFERAGVESALTQGIDEQSGGRLDRDEQRFGSIAKQGVITEAVDAGRGIVRIRLDNMPQRVTAHIQQFTAPVLTIGSRVNVLWTGNDVVATPLAQYPPLFTGVVDRVLGATGAEIQIAEVRHELQGLDDFGVVLAPTLQSLAEVGEGYSVLVATTPRERISLTPRKGETHLITGIIRRRAQDIN